MIICPYRVGEEMRTAICGVATLCLVSTGAIAQDLTWGCAFDRFSGKTYCLEVDSTKQRNTGRVVESKPNIGIPGTYTSTDGRQVRVYLGGNGTGHQDLGW